MKINVLLFVFLLSSPSFADVSCFAIFEKPFRFPSEDALGVLIADYGNNAAVLVPSDHPNIRNFFDKNEVTAATLVNALQILNTMGGRSPLADLHAKAIELVREFPPRENLYSTHPTMIGGMLKRLTETYLPGLNVKISYTEGAGMAPLKSSTVQIAVILGGDGVTRALIYLGRNRNKLTFVDPEMPQDTVSFTLESINTLGVYSLELAGF